MDITQIKGIGKADEHAHPSAVGIVDDSGNPQKGSHTAAVRRQWCGNTGKTDNCVVGVHIAYVAGDFQCILDSDLYLPQMAETVRSLTALTSITNGEIALLG